MPPPRRNWVSDMTLSRRQTLLAVLGLGFVDASPGFAFESTKFTVTALADALKTRKPVLVAIHAPWCPVCKVQAPILDKLLATDKFSAYQTLLIDFDSQKNDVARLQATIQSTLIVYKNNKEVGREVGCTEETVVDQLLSKAL